MPASEGAPLLRYTTSELITLASLPVPDYAAARINAVVKASPPQPVYAFVIIQVHGTILDATYVNDTAPLPQEAIDIGTQLAIITGERLAAATASTTA